MGVFDKVKNMITKPFKSKTAQILNGYAPIYSQFGTDIYKSDVVQQAIYCIVTEIKKLRPVHIRQTNSDIGGKAVNDDIQAVLNNPNPLMTTSDFLEKIMWQLFLNYNSFVLPTYEDKPTADGKNVIRTYTGIYPLSPRQVDFIEDNSGRLFVKLLFKNGESYLLKYEDLIHIKSHYSLNDYMGGDESGNPNNQPLLKTLDINDKILYAAATAAQVSMNVNAVVKYNTLLDDGKTEKALKELERKLRNNESGILGLDNAADYIPIKKDLKLVDADTLKFIDEKILRNYGVSIAILKGDYTKAQYEAFYQKTLEPIIISLNQAFTKTFFTAVEKAHGNRIEFYPEDLVFMTVDQKLEMVRLLGDSGSLYENEKRRAFGLPPLPELEGVRMQSLNYVNIEIATKYQVGADKNE